MEASFLVRAASACMLLAVALGAFGAHGLKNVLSEEMKAVFETGVRYHAYHALGLFAAAWVASRWPSRQASLAGACFIGGIILFSGSLYALSLTGARKLGAVTPFGGLLFIAGWASLLAAPYKN